METVWTDMMTLLKRRGEVGVEKEEEREVHRRGREEGLASCVDHPTCGTNQLTWTAPVLTTTVL